MTSAAPVTEDAARGADRARLGLVTVLLAAALALHVLWWHGPVLASPWAVVVAAGAWAVARPTSVARLATLLAAAGVAVLLELPALGTHLLLVLVLGGGVLAHLLVRVVGGRGAPDAAASAGTLVALLRAQVVVLYVAAAVAKLNADYLDPSRSPAGDLAAQVAWLHPDLLDGRWLAGPAAWGSVGLELALPVLLLVRRTRTVGLVLGLLFHAALALAGTVPFTALVLVLYAALVPSAVPVRLGRIARRLPRRAVRVGLPLVLVGAWLVAAAPGDVAPGRTDGGVLASALRVLTAGAALAGVALVVAAWRDARRARSSDPAGAPPSRPGAPTSRATAPTAAPTAAPRRRRRPSPVVVAATLVLVVVAASPYAGRRLGDAFTMYSALDTSERGWNSAVVPHAARRLGQ